MQVGIANLRHTKFSVFGNFPIGAARLHLYLKFVSSTDCAEIFCAGWDFTVFGNYVFGGRKWAVPENVNYPDSVEILC